MILVTTGTQVHFDRLVAAIDEIAPRFPSDHFIIQVKKTHQKISSKNVEIVDFISPALFTKYMRKAELIISHAGVGTIINAALQCKHLILFPRLRVFKEHRNDHQLATCKMLQETYSLNVANNVDELFGLMHLFKKGKLAPMEPVKEAASPELITSLKNFVEEVVKDTPKVLSDPIFEKPY